MNKQDRRLRAIFFAPYPEEGPSARYRVVQYFPFLEEEGIDCTYAPFFSKKAYQILYRPGNFVPKVAHFAAASLRRLYWTSRVREYDVAFVHLEIYPLFIRFYDRLLRWSRRPVIFDLDDTIFIHKPTVNPVMRYLRNPKKVDDLLLMSRHVVVCNRFMDDYSRKYNSNVTIIHTPVDTEKFKPRTRRDNGGPLVLGWIGSHSTAYYLDILRPVLSKLAEAHDFVFKVVGAGVPIEIPGVKVENLDWRLDREVADFQSFDIGLYPMIDNEFAIGKTGFKTIQYMAFGIPSVVSAVGANKVIVKDGENALLADNDDPDSWVRGISRLMEDSELRRRVGDGGRQTVLDNYSLQKSARVLASILRGASERGAPPGPGEREDEKEEKRRETA